MAKRLIYFEFLRYHAPVAGYGALIVILSSIPQTAMPPLPFEGVDVVIHFLEYAVFALLISRSFSRAPRLQVGALAPLAALLFVTLFSAGDEYHQKFVSGRNSSFFDFFADLVGAGCVILLYHRRPKRRISS